MMPVSGSVLPASAPEASEMSGAVPVKPGNGPGGRRLRRGETVPLSAAQSERLAALYEVHGARLVRYAWRRLTTYGGAEGTRAWSLAEDLAQQAWMQVARTAEGNLLLDAALPEGEARALLYTRMKWEVAAYLRRRSSAEVPVDWQDAVTCASLCRLLPERCVLEGLPPYLARMLAGLPEREREALALWLDGTPLKRIADRLGCSSLGARNLVDRALLLLQIDNPELSAPPVALVSLPAWEQRALSALSPVQREALVRLGETERRAMLLLSEGASIRQAAETLGGPDAARVVQNVSGCLAVLRAVGAWHPRAARKSSQDQAAQAIAATLREEISGMRVGDRLPRYPQLKARFSVGCRVIVKAFAILREQGLVESRTGRTGGTFVAATRARMAVTA